MTRTFFRCICAIVVLTYPVGAGAVEFVVDSVEDDEITAVFVDGEPAKLDLIYDAYRSTDDDGVYRDFVDSVYVWDVNAEGAVVFRSVWRGGGKYLSEGDILVPTGRSFDVRHENVVALTEPERAPGEAGVFLSAGAGARTAISFGTDAYAEPRAVLLASSTLSILITNGSNVSVTIGSNGVAGTVITGLDLFAAYTIQRVRQQSESALDIGLFAGSYADNSVGAVAFGLHTVVRRYATGRRIGVEAGFRTYGVALTSTPWQYDEYARSSVTPVNGMATLWEVYLGAAYRFRRFG